MIKTNFGLVEYCKKQLGLPYWWGTFGQIASENLYYQKKAQYPTQYTENDFKNQYGKRVHDCVGLIKGYLWQNENGKIIYNANQDKNVSGMLKNCKKQGSIDTIPEMPGVLVFMTGHVGIYIGKGQVIEAKGHKYGVVQTNLKDRPWTKWGKLNWITYEEVKVMTEEDAKKIVQEKTGFDDNTMFWLSRYVFHENLFIKWAESYLK